MGPCSPLACGSEEKAFSWRVTNTEAVGILKYLDSARTNRKELLLTLPAWDRTSKATLAGMAIAVPFERAAG